MKEVLVSTSKFGEFDTTPIKVLKHSGYDVTLNPYQRKLTTQELRSLLHHGVIGLIAGVEKIDESTMANSNLAVISRCGSGMANVDLEAAKKLNIKIKSTPQAPVGAVAELTIGAAICSMRKLHIMNEDLHEKKWQKHTGWEIKNKVSTIIGFGRIGKRVASLLESFGAKILVVDPNLANIKKYTLTTLKKALPISDLIFMHADCNSCILDAEAFACIKNKAFIFNASRGHLIDESALVAALTEKKISGAWIDVFSDEPYNGRLIEFPEVVLSPHVGSYTMECRKQMELECVNNIIEAIGN